MYSSGSGSGSSRTASFILRNAKPDPYRDQHPGDEKVDELNFFLENFNIVLKILKIMAHLIRTDEKDKTM